MTVLQKAVRNSLVFYDSLHTWRWYDAIGPGVGKYIETFAVLPLASADTLLGWTTTLVEGGSGESTVTHTDGVGEGGGQMLLTADDNENDGINLQVTGESFYFDGVYPAYFGIRLKLNDATQTDFLVGFAIDSTDALGGVTDGLYFRKVDASTTINLVAEKNSAENDLAVGTAADATWVTLEMYFDGSQVDAYVNGVAAGSITSGLPNDEVLALTIHFLTGEGVANTMHVDWVRAIQVR